MMPTTARTLPTDAKAVLRRLPARGEAAKVAKIELDLAGDAAFQRVAARAKLGPRQPLAGLAADEVESNRLGGVGKKRELVHPTGPPDGAR